MIMWTKVMDKLYRAFIGREEEERAEKKLSYEQILCAHARCFKWRNGAYYVGNHRLVDGFDPARAVVPALAINKQAGYPLPIKTCKMISGDHTLFIDTEILNRNIPSRDVQKTAQNFASELSKEYKKHLKDVLAEAEL